MRILTHLQPNHSLDPRFHLDKPTHKLILKIENSTNVGGIFNLIFNSGTRKTWQV